jgi:glycosyltransferase involved in cell wall biosynthesis
MRVAVVGVGPRPTLDPEGADRLDWLATALADRGHTVTRFGPAWWVDRPSSVEASAVNFRILTTDPAPRPRQLAARLPAALREFDPDVIHTNHTTPLVVATAAATATLRGVPLAVDWYDVQPSTGWPERLRRLAVLAPDLVVPPSRFVQTALREVGRATAGVPVIPSPIDMDAIMAVDPEPQADLVYSRRLDAGSNLESLLLSLAEIRELDWEVAVVGDGPARDRYEFQAEELRIADRVRFLGEQPLNRRLALLRGAHAYAHTAHQTPFAVELLRALACGCVGIVEYHANSAAHEIIEQRVRGLRVTEEEGLAAAIRAATEFEQRTIDETYEAYDVAHVLDRYLDAYGDVGAGA